MESADGFKLPPALAPSKSYAGAAIHGQHHARDKARGGRAKVGGGQTNVCRRAKTVHRRAAKNFFDAFRVAMEGVEHHVGFNPAGEWKPEKGVPRPAEIMMQETSFNGGRGRFDCQPKRLDCKPDVSACKQSLCVSRHGSGVSKHDHREGKHDDVACKHGDVVYRRTRSVCEHGRWAGKHDFSDCKQNDRACKHRLCAYKHRTWNPRFRDKKCPVSGKLTTIGVKGRNADGVGHRCTQISSRLPIKAGRRCRATLILGPRSNAALPEWSFVNQI